MRCCSHLGGCHVELSCCRVGDDVGVLYVQAMLCSVKMYML